MNTTDDIEKAFQQYYITTVLSQATDPNILHNLERDLSNYKLFESREVDGFIDMHRSNASPDKLNAALDAVVQRASTMLPEERAEFKSKATDYIRKYAFISQILTFEDLTLEKLYIFLKFLLKKLPQELEALPKEILGAVNMELYHIENKGTQQIKLAHEAGEVDPMDSEGSQWTTREEIDPLSKIIKDINERFQTDFNADDRVILNDLSQRLVNNPDLSGAIRANSRDNVKIKFDDLFNSELVNILQAHLELYQKLDGNPELKNAINDHIFEFVFNRVKMTNT